MTSITARNEHYLRDLCLLSLYHAMVAGLSLLQAQADSEYVVSSSIPLYLAVAAY